MVLALPQNVFAQIAPATSTRIDTGLPGYTGTITRRVVATGGAQKGNRITHRIELAAPAAIDAEVNRWLMTAYDVAE
jgi:hypothetical protein